MTRSKNLREHLLRTDINYPDPRHARLRQELLATMTSPSKRHIIPSLEGGVTCTPLTCTDPTFHYEKEEHQHIQDDPVNHPKHYTSHPSGIECIEVTRHMSFNIGNAMKYLWRADEKGNPIENLKKAIWYINDEIEKREKSGQSTK